MKNKKKLDRTTKVLIGIFVVIVLLIGLLFSYAYYGLDIGGTLSNSNITGTLECLDISYAESNTINLTNAHPVTDDYALTKMTPVTVTITNNCGRNQGDISYTLALSTIYEKALNYDDKYIPDTKIRTHVKKTVEGTEKTKLNTKFLSELDKLDTTSNNYKYITSSFTKDSNYTNYNIKDMYKLDSGLIKNNEVITYKVYMWIDYYEGDPSRKGEEYNNSTKGKKFEGAVSLVANAEEYTPEPGVEIIGNIAQGLIESDTLWQSGLEGDGYRYIGIGGVTCSYDNGKYIGLADNQDTTPSCPTLYNYTKTYITNGAKGNYTYQPSCPSNNSSYTYSCTELNGTIIPESINAAPNNYICFGTNNLEECKANEDKYMYRIIGVFPDDTGEQHLKLIKYKQLGAYYWHSDGKVDVSWEESDLYKGLNGISGGSSSNLFVGNPTYDYLQENNPWYEKIVDWKWTATNTLSCGEDGQCNEATSGPDYSAITTEQIYLHEMNRSTKTNTIGEWTYPIAKIGLMYVSDYRLSLGSSSLTMTGRDEVALKTGWIHQSNNDITKFHVEWTLSRYGNFYGDFLAWRLGDNGDVEFFMLNYTEYAVRPVFYLDSTIETFDGSGIYSDPYLINR